MINTFKEIWLVSKNNPKNRVLLYSHGRSADILFSPDEKWLVINNYLGSDASNILLYKKDQGELHYTEINNADISHKAWTFYAKEYKLTKPLDFGHHYAETVLWSADSSAFIVSIWGHADGFINGKLDSLDRWLCIFDINTQEMSSNLGLMNKNVFHSD
jgi:hypothetical protein